MKPPIVFFLTLLTAAFTGCVSTKYKMAPDSTPAATLLNLPPAPSAVDDAGPPAIEAMLSTVVAFQGPGSWKREAYWDEYVIVLANRSAAGLRIESATLTDFRGENISAGDNPWTLEKQSRSYEAEIARTVGDVLKVGSATVLTGAAAGSFLIYAGMNVASTAGAAAVLGGTVVLAAATVAIPVYSTVANHHNKRQVEAEFRRRRYALPVVLAPNQFAQGSLFFRISPGPRRLVLRCSVGRNVRDVVFDLTPLADLHLKPQPLALQQP